MSFSDVPLEDTVEYIGLIPIRPQRNLPESILTFL